MSKVYKRKIHVYRTANELDRDGLKWIYVWSTNAYPTCKAAIAGAIAKCGDIGFRASFAKD